MRIDVISDIHLTHFRDFGADFVASWVPEGEILVLAGDVGEFHWWQMGFDKLRILCANYQHTLFVPGNHDYYGSNFLEADARFEELAGKIDGLHFLNRQVLEIDGVRFAGTTLWFRNSDKNQYYSRYLSDFRLIRGFVPAVYHRNQEDRDFLKGLAQVDVVITHHMPSAFSVHEKYANDPTNLFFLCEMDDVILDLQPKLWIHGHTHVPFDYKLGSTRVLCNPKGYPRERTDLVGNYGPVTVEL